MPLLGSLRVRIILPIIGAIVVGIIIGLTIVNLIAGKIVRDNVISGRVAENQLVAQEIEDLLSFVETDIFALRSLPPIQGIIRARDNEGVDPTDGSTLGLWQDRLATIFQSLMVSKKNFVQLRYLDENGQELVRVDWDGVNTKTVRKDRLQNKANRYYFQEGLASPISQVYISPIDLNREGDPPEISIPYLPVVRYALPVEDQAGQRRGVLVANVLADKILAHEEFPDDQERSFAIIDSDGYYIEHADRTKEWGSERDLGHGVSFFTDYPGASKEQLSEEGLIEINEESFVVSPIKLAESNQENTIWLLQNIKSAVLAAPVRSIQLTVSAVALSVALFLSVVVWFVLGGVLDPLRRMSKQLRSLRRGNLQVRNDIERTDELGELASDLNELAQQLVFTDSQVEERAQQQGADLVAQKEELEKQQEAMLNLLESVGEEKKKSEELAHDLEKFKLAIQSTSEHIIITDSAGTVLFANPAVERITGYSINEVIGAKPSLWGGQMGEKFYKKMWHRIAVEKKPFTGEIKNKRKDGREYMAQSTISPILNKQGEVTFYVGIERDITREKQIDQAKTEFVSLASHQLRTPLSAINWYTEMLINGDVGKINKDQKKYLEEIYTGVRRMVDLINALLNVSRLELGTFMVDPKPMKIEEAINPIEKELALSMNAKDIQFTKKIDESLPELNLDVKLMTIVFQNLLSNAVKYTPPKGKINLLVEKQDKDFAITISDTGLGIPSGQQNRIFEKLFRADNVRSEETDGTGLGLYIVKAIVDSAKGKIWFESEENKGTTFHITMPLSGMIKTEGSKPLESNN